MTFEERFTILEQEMAELKQNNSAVEPKQDWIKKITGLFKERLRFWENHAMGQGEPKVRRFE